MFFAYLQDPPLLLKEMGTKKEDCPVTNSTFNEVKEYQSNIQDGRGGVLNGNQRPPG